MDAELLMADLENTHISEGPETIAVISQAITTYARSRSTPIPRPTFTKITALCTAPAWSPPALVPSVFAIKARRARWTFIPPISWMSAPLSIARSKSFRSTKPRPADAI